MEEFVLDFVNEGSLTSIDMVMEITGLTYEEVKSCSKILVIDNGIQLSDSGNPDIEKWKQY